MRSAACFRRCSAARAARCSRAEAREEDGPDLPVRNGDEEELEDFLPERLTLRGRPTEPVKLNMGVNGGSSGKALRRAQGDGSMV